MLNFNTAAKNPIINLRETRASIATIMLGAVEVIFKKDAIMLNINSYIRENNKQIVVDMERILNQYIGNLLTADMIGEISLKLSPLAEKIDLS